MATALISTRCQNYPNAKWLEAQLQRLEPSERARIAVFLDDTRTLGLMAQKWHQEMFDIARSRDSSRLRDLAKRTSLKSIKSSREVERVLKQIYQAELASINANLKSDSEPNIDSKEVDPILNCINQQSQCLDLIYVNVVHHNNPLPVVHVYEARKILPELALGNSKLPESLQKQILDKYSFEISVIRQQLL